MERGINTDSVMGTDLFEQSAHSTNYLLEQAQSRKSAGLAAPVRAVPLGLDPLEHFRAGCIADSPLSDEPRISDDLEYAVRIIVREGSNIAKWREEQFKSLRAASAQLKEFREHLNLGRGPNSLKCAANINLENVALAIHLINWPDRGLVDVLRLGAKPCGVQRDCGIYRHKISSSSLTIEEMVATNQELLDTLHMKKPPTDEMVAAVFEKTVEEQELGFLSPFLTRAEVDAQFGRGKWAAMLRFPVWQGKWRLIDNAKTYQNMTCHSTEAIHTTSSPAAAALTSCYRKHLGRPLSNKWRIVGYSKDMWKAYRQVPIHEDQMKLCIVILWHPSRKEWVFCIAHVLLFGLSGAVNIFNEIPTLVTAFARRYLAIPMQHFFDDHRLLEPLIARDDGFKNFDLLGEWFGFKYDPAKDQGPLPSLPMLGNIEDYTQCSREEVVIIRAKPERVEAIKESIIGLLSKRSCDTGEAATLRGRMVHLASTKPGRTGKGMWATLHTFASGLASEKWSDTLELELYFMLALLELPHERKYNICRIQRHRCRIWSDASFHTLVHGPHMQICAIMSFGGVAKGFVCVVPQEDYEMFIPRKSHIAIGEMFGVMLAIRHFKDALTASDAIFFIDNMSVIYALANGTAKVPDLGSLTFATNLQLNALQVADWFEYVPSWSNLADGGSRDGFSDAMAKEVGCPLEWTSSLQLPPSFPWSMPADWKMTWSVA